LVGEKGEEGKEGREGRARTLGKRGEGRREELGWRYSSRWVERFWILGGGRWKVGWLLFQQEMEALNLHG
jgi:hypothetical protein